MSSLPSVPTDLNVRLGAVDLLGLVIPVFPDCTRRPMKTILRGSRSLLKASSRGKRLATAMLLSVVASSAMTAQAQDSIGDLSGYTDEDFYAAEAAYESEQYSAGDLNTKSSPTEVDYAPISYSDMATVPTPMPIGSAYDGGCSPTSTVSCSAPACKPKRRKIGSLATCQASDMWTTAEFLMWFPQARTSAPLITTAPPGLAPIIGPAYPDTQVVFGGEDGLGGDLTPGFRIDAGKYLSKNFGIGGRFWFLGEDEASYSAQSDGTAFNLGRPIYDTNASQNDAILVGATDVGGNTLFAGSITAESKLEMIAGEAYGRLMFACGDEYRTDLIGGYTYFGIDDSLFIESTSVEVTPPTGDSFTFSDTFTANNDFHGGQIGFETTLSRGRWMFSTLTKVHLGNMNQQLSLQGTATETVAGTPPTVTVTDGGLLALDSQGEYERDVFAFVPEANVKLGYRFRDHVLFTAGYSFLYWSNVATAGEYVNPVFDATTRATGGPFGQPPLVWKDSSLIVQGIDLGVVIDF